MVRNYPARGRIYSATRNTPVELMRDEIKRMRMLRQGNQQLEEVRGKYQEARDALMYTKQLEPFGTEGQQCCRSQRANGGGDETVASARVRLAGAHQAPRSPPGSRLFQAGAGSGYLQQGRMAMSLCHHRHEHLGAGTLVRQQGGYVEGGHHGRCMPWRTPLVTARRRLSVG